MENWTTEMNALLKTKTFEFSEQEREKISYSYLVNLLARTEDKTLFADEELRSTIEFVVGNMPSRRDGKLLYMKNHINEISNLKIYIEEKYSLVPKGKFKRRFFPLGISIGPALGLAFGVAFGNIALGLILGFPIGIAFGVMYGNYLDRNAEMENRVV
jgi:hypothetical protein